ncbi:MAG TPA: hypothetical protein VFV23_03420 [Verrucomicrobiae bacterium]|nr:hypothetical protein [Verrucomicrobiae bacterium]
MRTNILKSLVGIAAVFAAAQIASAQVNTNNVNPSGSNVTTQNVTAASGINSASGGPGALDVTGVGATTPANSLTVRNNASPTNSVMTNSTTTVSETPAAFGATFNFNHHRGRGILTALLERRANMRNNSRAGNGLVARLLRAGSISSGGSGTAKTNSTRTSNALTANAFSGGTPQAVDFNLTFFERGGNGAIAKRPVTSSDIIASLGSSTSNDFSTNAVLIYTANTNGGADTIEVEDGNNVVDVSNYFSVSNSETQVSGTMNSGDINSDTNSNSETGQAGNGRLQNILSRFNTLSILHVTFNSAGAASGERNADLSFRVSGFNTTSASGTNSGPQTVNANVSGIGRDNGAPAIVTGTITVNGAGQ